MVRALGIIVLILPHLIGAPIATGENVVPVQLIHRFTLLSIITTGMFWLLLGFMGGFVYRRIETEDVDAFGSAQAKLL